MTSLCGDDSLDHLHTLLDELFDTGITSRVDALTVEPILTIGVSVFYEFPVCLPLTTIVYALIFV